MNSQKKLVSQLKISVKESTRNRQKERRNKYKKKGMFLFCVEIGHYKSSRMMCGYKNGSDPVSIARTAQGVVQGKSQ